MHTLLSGTLELVPKRTRKGLVAVLAILIAWWAFGTVAAPSRISPQLADAIAANPDGYVDIDVHFREGPTRFHLTRYQEFGHLGRTDGNTLLLRRVEAREVRDIARDYWIRWIDLYSP